MSDLARPSLVTCVRLVSIENNWQKHRFDLLLEGEQSPNYYGSLTQSTTIRLGSNNESKEVHIPFNTILPMLHPNDIVIGGWDINGANLSEAMKRACVFDYALQEKLATKMSHFKPLPSIYYPDFIAANQEDRANNLIPKGTKQQDLEHIRKDIRAFKKEHNLEQVIVLWTANTERYTDGNDAKSEKGPSRRRLSV